MLTAREANRDYFHEAYRSGEHGWAIDTPSPYAVAFLDRVAAVVSHGRLLDSGCGEGRHAIAAAERGFRVTAVDFEPLALERARRFARAKGARQITFRKADILDLPFGEASFDVVLDYGCLHHQRKSAWPTYKSGILRVLRPHGYYILSVFSPRFRFFRHSRRPWHIAHGAYRRCFTAEDLTTLFERDFDLLTLTEEQDPRVGFWHALMQRR